MGRAGCPDGFVGDFPCSFHRAANGLLPVPSCALQEQLCSPGATQQAWKKHVEYVGFREFNSQFPWWGPGDLVFHLPGRTNKERIRLFAEIIVAANFTDGTVPNMHRVLEPEPNPDHLLGMDYSQLNTKEKQSGGWFPTVFVQPGAHPHLGSS